MLSKSIDQLMLGAMISPIATAVYGTAIKIANLVEAGLTPQQSLLTATVNPGQFLQRRDLAGRVAIRQRAADCGGEEWSIRRLAVPRQPDSAEGFLLGGRMIGRSPDGSDQARPVSRRRNVGQAQGGEYASLQRRQAAFPKASTKAISPPNPA